MAEITNLDELAGPPRKVILGGDEYLLPPDIPVDLFIEMAEAEVALAADDADELEIIKQLRDQVLELFQFHQPDLESLPRAAGFKTVLQLVGSVYRGAAEQEDEPAEAEAPPTAPKRTKTGTRTRRPSASASSS